MCVCACVWVRGGIFVCVYVCVCVLPPAQSNVPRLTVVHSQPGHTNSSGRKNISSEISTNVMFYLILSSNLSIGSRIGYHIEL